MRMVMLFVATFGVSLRRDIAHRGNLVMSALLAVVGSVVSLLTVEAVFTQTQDLAGWQRHETIVLLGTFQIMGGMLATLVEPNLLWFGGKVQSGELDDQLLRPVPALFSVSMGIHAPLGLLQVMAGMALCLWGLGDAGERPSALATAGWVWLLAAGMAVTWASRVAVALLALWFPSLSLDVVYSALWQFARYPVAIFNRPTRVVLTWVVPLALVSTLPARMLVGRGGVMEVVFATGVGAVSVVLVGVMWRRGIRRYTGATS